MMRPVRFPYVGAETASRLPYLPITLHHEAHSVAVSGLLDTGSTVNVLPHPIGLELGLVWEQHTMPVHLTGNLARLSARAVIVSGQVGSLPPVRLVFAWTQSEVVPAILGQVNFFLEFDVCFFGSESAFEVQLKRS